MELAWMTKEEKKNGLLVHTKEKKTLNTGDLLQSALIVPCHESKPTEDYSIIHAGQ